MSHANHNVRRDPLHAAKEKGRKAWDAGLTLDACPYNDARTHRGSVTWSRSFIRAWVAGWRERDTGAEWTP